MQLHCDLTANTVWRIQLQPGDRSEIVITAGGLQQLRDVLSTAERSDDCRVLVIEGSGGSFCRGMDLDAVASEGADPSAGLSKYADCLCAMRESSKTVIAAVDGAVLAGGVGLAAVADLLIATERSHFGLPEVMLGLMPAMVLPVLMERMAPQKARRLALGAASVDAAEAWRLGLVDRLVPDADRLERAIRAELKNLLRMEPAAVAALKQLTSETATMSFREAVAAGRAATKETLARAETREAIQGFLEGDTLPWFARYRRRSK